MCVTVRERHNLNECVIVRMDGFAWVGPTWCVYDYEPMHAHYFLSRAMLLFLVVVYSTCLVRYGLFCIG